LLRGAPRQD